MQINLKSNWNEMRDRFKTHWGKLTKDEVFHLEKMTNDLAGFLKKKYGYEKNKIRREIEYFLKKYI